MDWQVLLISIGISLFFTMFGYLLIPTILAVLGKKYSAKKIKTINLINCIVVWVLFRFLQIALGNDPTSGAAVILWGAVGHWILKKYCAEENPTTYVSRHNTSAAPSEHGSFVVPRSDVVSPTHAPITTRVNTYCPRCGKVIPSDSRECQFCENSLSKSIQWKHILGVMMFILFIASITGNIILLSKNIKLNEFVIQAQVSSTSEAEIANLNTDILILQEENNKLQNQVDNLAAEIAFYDEYVVFVEDDGTNQYHNYDCFKFKGEYFWAYNIDAAKDEGFTPCFICQNDAFHG